MYTDGIRAAGRLVVLFALPRAEPGTARLGVTASRKVGNAVVRNRVKRRLREVFRVRFPDRWWSGVDLVVNATRGCATASWGDLVDDFDRCVVRLQRRLSTERGAGAGPAADAARGGDGWKSGC